MTAQVQPAMLLRLDAAWLTQYTRYTCVNSLRHFFYSSSASCLSHEVETRCSGPPMHADEVRPRKHRRVVRRLRLSATQSRPGVIAFRHGGRGVPRHYHLDQLVFRL